MRKIMIAAIAALCLSACATTSTSKPAATVEALAPILAPVAGNHVTAEAIDLAFATSDAALYVVDFMRSVGWITDGSPKARELADAAADLKRWLVIADAAQTAGDQAKADGAFANAKAAYSIILKALERKT